MGKSIVRWSQEKQLGAKPRDNSAPGPIVTMSLQLAIPRQVALPQSLLPLHQPHTVSCKFDVPVSPSPLIE